LIAVAAKSKAYDDIKSLSDLHRDLLEQMEHFFISYNEIKGKRFKPLGRFGVKKAMKIIREGTR